MSQAHYYGDKVRTLLISAAVIMVLTMPFFSELIPKPTFFSILAALIVIILSGLISPRQKIIVLLSLLVSAGGFLAFQYYALGAYQTLGFKSAFFLINELLALLYLISTYFATKSVRGLTAEL
jgi:hypothetical protein